MTPDIKHRNEIIQKSIAKAVSKGFKILPKHFMTRVPDTGEIQGYEVVIFDHKFCKAIWGDEFIETGLVYPPFKNGKAVVHQIRANHFHASQMAIANDRLAYLEQNT